MTSKWEKDLSASATPAHLIEPYANRRARLAPARKISIAREAAELAATYARLRLPVPMRLTPKPLPEPEVVFTPFKARRQRGATGRRDAVRATVIRGSGPRRGHKATGRPPGRPPNQSLAAAIRSGASTYQGRPCRYGHPAGIRYVLGGNNCVECQRARNKGAKSRRMAHG